MKDPIRRRTFLKSSALSLMPFIAPVPGLTSAPAPAEETPVNFILAGEMLTTRQYAERLHEICHSGAVEADSYGEGGCVAELESRFEAITGKEKAIFMPTGTMANQLAVKVLSGENVKVIVQENSHINRDEADAAQTLHSRRLIPVGKERAWFTVDDLKAAVDHHSVNESFPSPIGAVAVEIPTRRSNNTMMPIGEFRKISEYCRENNIPLHLDGARLFIAAAWSGVPVSEYASLADTVYISLYKYFGAASGAILCGKEEVIDKMPRLMKMYGGSMYRNWTNAAVALQQVDGYMDRLVKAKSKGEELIAMLNRLPQIKISSWPYSTHIHRMELKGVNPQLFVKSLAARNITAGSANFMVNVSILHRDNDDLFNAFKNALSSATL
jgi:threonine aldolase